MLEENPELTDSQLIQACREDSTFFGIIMDRYRPKLSRYLSRRSAVSRADIDDLLQNIFIKIYRNINEYNESLLFSSWIYRIAHNEMIDWYRKQKVRASLSLDDASEPLLAKLIAPDDSVSVFDEAIEKKRLGDALETLDEKYKDILILRYFEEKSYDEIADIIKLPSGTVATRINRAKKELRKHYDLHP